MAEPAVSDVVAEPAVSDVLAALTILTESAVCAELAIVTALMF